METIYSDENGLTVAEPTNTNHYVAEMGNGKSQFIFFQDGSPVKDNVNGLTNEALLAILTHRLTAQNEKFRCDQNEKALDCMISARSFLEERNLDRKQRGVKNKDIE